MPKGSLGFVLDAAELRRATAAVCRRQVPLGGTAGGASTNLLATGGFDLVVCDFLAPVANVPEHLPCPSVLFTHNVEAEIWRRHAETARSPLRKALLSAQWRRTVRFERDAVRRFDLVLAVSDTDRRTLLQAYGPLRQPVHVVPTGVDTALLRGGHRRRAAAAPGVHRVDGLAAERGRDALSSSATCCRSSAARNRAPRSRSSAARRRRPIVKLGSEYGVEVTGRVDDVRPHMAAAAVYIVPLRIGGGTRLKIFEAMAMGKPVVSTTIGAEGLPVEAGRRRPHRRLADGVCRRGRAPVPRARRSARASARPARRLVAEQYDWSAVFGHLEQALEAAAGGSRHRDTAPVPALELQTRN